MQLPSVIDTSDSDTDSGEVELYRPPAGTRASFTADLEHILALEGLLDRRNPACDVPDGLNPLLGGFPAHTSASMKQPDTAHCDQQHPQAASASISPASVLCQTILVNKHVDTRSSDDLGAAHVNRDKNNSNAAYGSLCTADSIGQQQPAAIDEAAAAAEVKTLSYSPSLAALTPTLLNQAGISDDAELDDLLQRLSANSNMLAAAPPADQQDIQEQSDMVTTAAVTTDTATGAHVFTAYQPRWARQAGTSSTTAAAAVAAASSSGIAAISASVNRHQDAAAVSFKRSQDVSTCGSSGRIYNSSNAIHHDSSSNSSSNSSSKGTITHRIWSDRSLVTIDLRSDLHFEPMATMNSNGTATPAVNAAAEAEAAAGNMWHVQTAADAIETFSDSSEDDWQQFRQQHQRHVRNA